MKAKEALRLCDRGLELIEEERERLRKIRRWCSDRLKRLRLEEARFRHYKRVIRKER